LQEETMRRRVQGGWLIMGIAVLGATIAGGREARAALGGLTITGGINPINKDPVDQLIFYVTAQTGTSILDGDYFTISGLPTGAQICITGWTEPSQGTFPSYTVSWVPYPDAFGPGTFTWMFEGSKSIGPLSSDTLLDPPSGNYPFSVTISLPDDSPNIPQAGVTQLYYSYNLDGHTLTTESPGSFVLGDFSVVVPEPSSAAMVVLIVGTAGSSGLIARRRRRARAA
jgi:hypothetical protein